MTHDVELAIHLGPGNEISEEDEGGDIEKSTSDRFFMLTNFLRSDLSLKVGNFLIFDTFHVVQKETSYWCADARSSILLN